MAGSENAGRVDKKAYDMLRMGKREMWRNHLEKVSVLERSKNHLTSLLALERELQRFVDRLARIIESERFERTYWFDGNEDSSRFRDEPRISDALKMS